MHPFVVSCLLVLLASPLLASVPADAEVLVMVDGSRLEIGGDVEIDGRRLTFTDTHGRLSMVRVSEVDLDATRRANEPPPAATEDASTGDAGEPDVEPVMTLTNDDVGTVFDDEIEGIEPEPKVVIYSTSWCPTCRKAKRLLDDWQVAYTERDIEKDALARDERDNRDPDCGVPVIDVGGQLMCGLQPRRLAEMLDAVGIEPVIKR